MSFFDDASLVFLPSGQAGKDGKAYSMKPTNGDGDFTFSRGSNLTATRVDSNGLIEKGRENLLLQSNQFDTTWANSGTNETSGQSGYDGSSDAWLLTKNVSDGYIYQNISQSGVQCVSVYAKANAIGGIQIYVNAGTTREQSFNLTNGTLIGSGNNIDAKIESVGNGWYRCSMALSDAITRVRFYPMTSAGDKSGTSGSIYIQDAQLEQGLVATEYIESGATTGLAGILEDSPRFDYSGGASCPSLLLEGSRTQLIPYTEYLSGLSLSGNPPTITQNYAVSPEGVQNAVRIQDTDATNYKIMQTQFSVTAGSTYTISVYVKKASSPISTYGGFYFDFDGGTRKTSNLIFDEYNGTLVNASGNAITSVIHPVIDEGDYWRFSATATDTGSNTLLRPTLRAGASANGTTLNLVTKDYTAYGFQCEQGSYPTSYIPNHSGGSVTRDADVCEGAGDSSTFNADEGVFYAEISTNTDDTDKAISLNNAVSGSLNNRLWMGYSTSNKRIYALGYVNNSLQFALSKLMTDESFFVKIACRYKRNDIAFFVNGVKVGTDTTALNFTELSSLDFNIGTAVSGASPFYGNVKQVLVFNSYLSDSEINTLTS